eukprot:scaffold248524_cov33-Prasinocladus_malaysianus.AAC.1
MCDMRHVAMCPSRAAGAPEALVVLLEGESLFNDATSIVLFEIFFEKVGIMCLLQSRGSGL